MDMTRIRMQFEVDLNPDNLRHLTASKTINRLISFGILQPSTILMCHLTGVSAAAAAASRGTAIEPAAEFFTRRLPAEPGGHRPAAAELSAAAVELCGQSAKLPGP